jgi:hypothetical protein
MRKPPLKENKFRRTQGKLNFQAKKSVPNSVNPRISSQQQLQNNGKFSSQTS